MFSLIPPHHDSVSQAWSSIKPSRRAAQERGVARASPRACLRLEGKHTGLRLLLVAVVLPLPLLQLLLLPLQLPCCCVLLSDSMSVAQLFIWRP